MDVELLNHINVDLKWNILKKGRRSMARRPRKTGEDTFEFGNKKQDSTAFETKKVVDTPLKRRRVVHGSPSTPPQISCLHGNGVLPPGPQTPSVHYEDPSQRYHSSLSQKLKTKSKTRLRNSNTSKPTKKVDFSGIELLAAAACSSFILDNADFVDAEKVLKEDTTAGVDSCSVDIKETESDGAEKKVALRLHWDLNTVMDEWEEPCDGFEENCSEGVKMKVEEGYESRCTEGGVSVNELPLIESCNTDSFEKTYESIEDMGIKTIVGKTSDCESSVSKSDIQEESIVKDLDSDEQAVSEQVLENYSEKKGGSEDPCGSNSNITEDEENGDTMEKVEEVGYDSPFEDGELREPKKEMMCYESDNKYKDKEKDDLGSIENPLSEKVEGQSSSLLVKEGEIVEESDCGSRKNVGRNSKSNIEKSDFGSWWDRKSSSHEHNNRRRNVSRDYYYNSPRDSGGYSNSRRRPSSSERKYEYDDNRYRFHSQEDHHYHYHYHYLERERERERKVRCHSPPKRQSRSGSPIAWHFQKQKNLDATQRQRGLQFDQPQPSSKFTDKRHSSIGYPDDHIRSAHNYKDRDAFTCTRK